MVKKMEQNEKMNEEISELKCLICLSKNIYKIFSNYPGYIEGTSFDIIKCNDCKTQFILGPTTPDELYNAIYKLDCVPGYDRYKRYAKSIIFEKKPLKFLSEQEFAYYSVYSYLRSRKVKNILEIGSGLGYLTYALNKEGYQTLGIDISKESIKNSINYFGPFYEAINLENLKKKLEQKYDLIIMTELIEHVDSPLEFINDCLPLLSENGVILLTTPHYNGDNEVWKTDLPPVHRFWFSEKSFLTISKKIGLEPTFIYPNKECRYNYNLLTANMFKKKLSNTLPTSYITSDLKDCVRKNSYHEGIFKKQIKKFVASNSVRYFSNIFYFRFIQDQPESFAIILSSRNYRNK